MFRRPFSLGSKLLLSFGLLCAILTAIGGVFLLSLRSIEKLNQAERVALHEIGILHQISRNVGLQQAGAFRHVAATGPDEEKRHEEVIAQLAEMDGASLADYQKTLDHEAEKRQFADILQAGKAYADRTGQLLALSRAPGKAETTAFALTTQVPAYDKYQMTLETLVASEETEGREIAAATSARIYQTKVIGDLLIGLAIIIAFVTAVAVLRTVRMLRRDKKSLQNEVVEHERDERALRESEARYRLLVNHSPDAVFVICEGKIVFVNPATMKLLNADRPEQLIDRSVSEIVHPDERVAVAHRLREIVQGELPAITQRRLLRLDGSPVEVESQIISFLFEGKPAVQVIARDVTERKRAEEEVQRSQKRLRDLIDGLGPSMFVALLSPEGILLEINQSPLVAAGLKPEDVLGKPFDETPWWAHSPEVRRQLREAITRAAHGEASRYDVRTHGVGDQVIDIDFSLQPLRDETGKVVFLIPSASVITERKQAEYKLVEQAELLNLAQDAIMVRDMDDRFEFWNHGAEVLYGWTAEEVRGRPNDDFLEYDTAIKILAERTLLETGAWSGECRHLTKKGDAVIVRSRWTLVRDEHGQPKSKLIIATDVTEQKKIEEQFLRAQRLESIGTLASGVAHDLNNILVPIMMAAPVLRGEMDPEERKTFLDIVESSAQRGADIIKQVLTFARGADGDRTLLQPIYILEEVSKIARQTFPKSIALRTRYDENIRSLEAVPTQLHQVLLNLCINARDAMPSGGELSLGAENFDVDTHYASMTPGATAGPHVMLQVSDTGSGIPKEVVDKIFDPFFTTKDVGQGTGLGLSTVAGIVRSHGGFIHVYSEPGHTSFKVFLPAKATIDASGVLPAEVLVPRGHGETILLVDDEPNIRQIAEVILKNHGYKVLLAQDGPSALALYAGQMSQIAVVVTDLTMPGMDGLMLVRTLRHMRPALKVIVSTGRTDNSKAAEITALNVDGCLTKPYTKRNLLLKLNHVLNSRMRAAA